MRYLPTLSLFLSDKLTSERSAANKYTKFCNIFTTGWFETSGLFYLSLSFSPETNVNVTAMAMSPVCGFARDNLSQRFGRDIGALWRLQQEIHVMGQEEVYFWFYLAHINMYYMSCSCHPQIILTKIMYLRITTF